MSKISDRFDELLKEINEAKEKYNESCGKNGISATNSLTVNCFEIIMSIYDLCGMIAISLRIARENIKDNTSKIDNLNALVASLTARIELLESDQHSEQQNFFIGDKNDG